jgi:hypothetical protein
MWAVDVGARRSCAEGEASDPLAADIAEWMLDHVWSAFVPADPIALDATDEVRTELDGAGWVESVRPTADPALVVVELMDGTAAHVDVFDGRVVESELPPLDPIASAPPGSGLVGERAGWSDGPALVVGNWLPLALPTGSSRSLAHDGDQWRFVGDGCATGGVVFAAADTVWLGLSGVAWTPVGSR